MREPAAKLAAEALRKIIDRNQLERQRTIEVDPAGNTYEIVEIDGPFATLAREALAALEAEQSRAASIAYILKNEDASATPGPEEHQSPVPEIDWDDPGVEHGYIPVTAPSASADRHSEASASRRENSNDRGGERPPPSPVPEDRERLATRSSAYQDRIDTFEHIAQFIEAEADRHRKMAEECKELFGEQDEAVIRHICSAGDMEALAVMVRDPLSEIRRFSPHATGEWRPISTAPKDGTRILVWRPQWEEHPARAGEDIWHAGEWWKSRRGQQPTHWMPLPPAPPSPKDAGQ